MKKYSLQAFQALGFLQEANRQFFHQFGFALRYDPKEDTLDVVSTSDKSGIRFAPSSEEELQIMFEKANNVLYLQKNLNEYRKNEVGYVIQPLEDLVTQFFRKLNILADSEIGHEIKKELDSITANQIIQLRNV